MKFLLANTMAACALFTSLLGNDAATLSATTTEKSSCGYHLILDCKGCGDPDHKGKGK